MSVIKAIDHVKIEGLFFCVMMCVSVCVWVGIQDMAGGRMGQDARRNFPWAHAGAHPDEVHLH